MVSCVHGATSTRTRLFYHAGAMGQADRRGVAVCGHPRRAARQGGNPLEPTSVQAPHAFGFDGRCYLFYNSSGRALHDRPRAAVAGRRAGRAGRDVSLPWAGTCASSTTRRPRAGSPTTAARPRWTAGGRAMMARTAPTPEGPWSKRKRRPDGGQSGEPVCPSTRQLVLPVAADERYRFADPLDFDGAELVAQITGIWFTGKPTPEIGPRRGRLVHADAGISGAKG